MDTIRPDLSQLHVLVLAGGASSRFHPVNKVFADPTGAGRSLIQQTHDRVAAGDGALIPPDHFHVVCGADAAGRIGEQLPIPAENILVEPDRRNTFPAILWGLAHIRLRSPEATVAILTSDHIIGDLEEFRAALTEAVAIAQAKPLVGTLAIEPRGDVSRWTSFGCLQADSRSEPAGPSARRIAGFEEKPDLDRARQMQEEGGWAWNSGMFVFRAPVLEKAMGHFHPETAVLYTAIVEQLAVGQTGAAAEQFRRLKGKIPHPVETGKQADHSIDYAIMMPLASRPPEDLGAFVIPARFSWHDIGSWDALREVLEADENGNLIIGDVEARDVSDSILLAEPGLTLRVEDLEGLVVIHAGGEQALIARQSDVRDIKPVVEATRQAGPGRVIYHECEDCRVDAPSGSVALFRVKGLQARMLDGVLEVSPLRGEGESLRSLGERPQMLLPVTRDYAWGDRTLPDLLGQAASAGSSPVAEAWLTGSLDPETSARLHGASQSLGEWIEQQPEILGDWSLALYGQSSPLFFKFLSSRFSPRVHLGFRPAAVEEVERDHGRPFREIFTEWVLRERDHLRALHASLRTEACTTREVFESFRQAHDVWVERQARSGWDDTGADAAFVEMIEPFLRDGTESGIERLLELLIDLRQTRRNLLATFNEVDLHDEADHLLLCPTAGAHAIFGLSHQSHPAEPLEAALAETLGRLRSLALSDPDSPEAELEATREEFERLREEHADHAPAKNEAWLPFVAGGSLFLLEAQQSSGVTRSWLDIYTPFEFRQGRFCFRKGDPETGLGDEEIEASLEELDFTPRDLGELRREAREIFREGPAVLREYIDDPARWPTFSLCRLDLEGAGDAEAHFDLSPPRGAFLQVASLRGAATVVHEGERVGRVAPGVPVFVPATMSGSLELRAREDVTLVLMSVATPWPLSSALVPVKLDSGLAES